MKYHNKISHCKFIVKQIKDLGINDKYLGFYFLVSIENILLNENEQINSFYKDIYPRVAKEYDKRECTIERDIRHLINQLWLDGDKHKLYNICSGVKPSCCKFIYAIKNYLIKQIA